MRGIRNEEISDELIVSLKFLADWTPVDATMVGATILDDGTLIGSTINPSPIIESAKPDHQNLNNKMMLHETPRGSKSVSIFINIYTSFSRPILIFRCPILISDSMFRYLVRYVNFK